MKPVFDAETIVGEEPEISIDPESEPTTDVKNAVVLAYLLVFDRETSSMFHLPRLGEVVIGRSETATLCLEDNTVSRHHAKLSVAEGEARIVDLGSQNGTWVNGERIKDERLLVSGDIINICSISLVFHARVRPSARRSVLAFKDLRTRAEEEMERALRYNRPLALLTIVIGKTSDKKAVELALFECLRLIDIIGWSPSHDQLLVLLPETGREEAELTAERLLELMDGAPESRAGVASCPGDGCDVDALLVASRAAANQAEARTVNAATATHNRVQIGDREVVVADPAMISLYDLIRRIAMSDLSALVHGETGTGKELVANALHFWSRRSKGPLLALNCAAIPENLVESELFGHEKGAFSGALAAKRGLLESASGGTVFLDEIGELPLGIQAKLLRVLETRRVARLGALEEREIDIRIVAATNKDLASDSKHGKFRADLFFRLSGATLWIPPLRDRKQDLPLLAKAFLGEACHRADREPMMVSDAAMQLLAKYPWPGNVRELRNVIDYAVAAFTEPVLEPWHLGARLASGPAGLVRQAPPRDGSTTSAGGPMSFRPIEEEVRELEKTRMRAALEAASGNQTRAAELISMPLRTFVTKLKQYELKNDPRTRR